MTDPANDGLSAMQASPSVTVSEPFHLTVDLESNVYSQSGEDGIIARILELYAITSGFYVDIGANDGQYLSNTALLRDKGWHGLVVEKEPQFYESLASLPNCIMLIEELGPLNAGILRGKIPSHIDLLSIDIDGDDISVVEALIKGGLTARIICIEYNSTYPPFLHFRNPLGTNKGSSMKAIGDILEELGYDIVYATISNVILVHRGWNNNVVRTQNSFEAFRWDNIRYVVCDYDGQNHLADMTKVVDRVVNPWDHIDAAFAIQYPEEVLGYNKNKSQRVIYNHWPRRPAQQE